MAFIRDVAFPAVGKALGSLGMTNDDICTHEKKISAGVSGVVAVILSDLHMGGVHNRINTPLVASRQRMREIVGTNTHVICLDVGDRLTLGSMKHRPTQESDIRRLGPHFSHIAHLGEGQIIWGVNGNHDRRMIEKMRQGELDKLNGGTREIGFRQIIHPVNLAGGQIRLHGMPCHNTQRELYTEERVRELIGSINSHSGVNIVMVHNPDGVRQIEEMKKQLGLRIDVPTLFLCGHTHGLLGFQDVPIIGAKLSQGARKWIGMERDTPYISGYYPAITGELYGTYVTQGVGDQEEIFRIGGGGRELPIFRFVGEEEEADIVLGR